jgi:DNA-binding NtrC family response regulator
MPNHVFTGTAAGDFSRMAKKFPGRRVLVVDDEPLIRWSLAEALGDLGHEVVEAGDARVALDLAEKTQPPFDVVLLDFRLPDSADLTLLSRLRIVMPKARIIMMTAHGNNEIVQGALDLGAVRVVSKPFEMSQMTALVAGTDVPTH